ncbi:MAG: replication initiation protein [Bacteroidota bacterium]
MPNEPISRNLPVAHFANTLAFNLSWNLNHREWNVVLYLVSKIDSKNQRDFTEQIVSVKELESALKEDGKKWGGLYEEISRLIKSLLRKPIEFYTDATINGKPLPGGIPLGSIRPFVGEKGETLIRFKFHEDLKPLLLELHTHFVGIPQYKTKMLKSGHAIRFLISAKAKRDMMREHEQVSCIRYEVDAFKSFLGIPGKYPRFDNFKARVILPIKREINQKCDFLQITDIQYIRVGRVIRYVEFYIVDLPEGRPSSSIGGPSTDYVPNEADLDQLSWAKRKAYDQLLKFGIKPGIALRQIVANIHGSEFNGFEDYFVEYALAYFRKTARQQGNKAERAGTFVTWWSNQKVFELGSAIWSDILETVVARKKREMEKDPEKIVNRQVAAKMTENQFKDWYKEKRDMVKG